MTNQAGVDDRFIMSSGEREKTRGDESMAGSVKTSRATRVHFPSIEGDDQDDASSSLSSSITNTAMTGSNVGIMNPVSTPTISVNRANAYAQEQPRRRTSGSSATSMAKMTPSPIVTNGLGGTGHPNPHTTPSTTTTTTTTRTTSTSPGSRRTPARPSPLSRLHSAPGPSTLDTVRSGNHTYTQRQAGQMMDSTTFPSMGYASSPMSAGLGGGAGTGTGTGSPCFVHSHLEKYSQLDDRVRQKLAGYGQGNDHDDDGGGGSGGRDGPRSMGGDRGRDGAGQEGSYHYRSGGGITFESSRSGGGGGGNKNGLSSMFGYNSDGPTPRFSSPTSSGPLDRGDDTSPPTRSDHHDDSEMDGSGRHKICAPSPSDLDDAEDGGSLTRQLAETATGVREMSKQLGRTKVKSNIQSVLIVTKARDNRLIKLTREVAVYLMQMKRSANSERGMIVYVDAQLKTSKRFDAAGLRESNPEFFKPLYRRRSSSTASLSTMSGFVSDASGYVSRSSSRRANGASGTSGAGTGEEGQLRYWTSEMCSSQPHLFDMVVTLGGDGTVLFTSWLFQRIVPPVLPFALGSLGFLTNFDFADYAKTLDKAVDDGIRVNLRMRFTCTVYRAVTPEQAAVTTGQKRKAIKSTGGDILISQVDAEGWEALEGTKPHEDEKKVKAKRKKDKEIMCFSTRPVETFEVLNDLVVDRGPSPYVSLLELFGDDHHLTTVQADGLCVATPTGSTAYSLSAGGSLVHPGIPALLISPICPHTLSFRPMLLPDGMELRVCVPYNSRSTAWASFDGRGRVELKQGDHIKIAASKYPFPTICRDKQSTDWFNSISRTLRWNEREKQKSFVVVEEDRANPVKEKTKKKVPQDGHLVEDRGGNENIRVDKPGKQSGKTAESGLDDKARVEASKKEADMGFQRMADMGSKVSAQQEKFRGGHPDEDDDEDSGEDDEEEEEEEEEEEGFDIDDVSQEPPASSSPESDKTPSEDPKPVTQPTAEPASSRPLYSTKRPSHLLTSLLSMTSQGGDGGYDDPGMKSGVETPDRFGAPYDPTRVSPKSPEAFVRKLDAGLHEALHDKQHHPHPNIRRTSSRREDMHHDSSTSDDVSSDLTEKTRAMGISDEVGQAYSSNSLHPNARMLPASPVDPMLSPNQRRTRSRSRSRSRSVTRGGAFASMPRDTSSSSARRLKSTSRSRTRSERTVGAQTETPNESEKDTEREDNGDRLEFVRPGRQSRTGSSASTITVQQAQGGHDSPVNGFIGSHSGSSSTERRPSIDKLRTPRASDYANVMNPTSRAGFLDPETVEEEDEEDEEEHRTKAFCFYGEDESESGQSDGESEA